MSIMDWSDSAEMVGLLAEYLDTELLDTEDRSRIRFLRSLADRVQSLGSEEAPTKETLRALLRIYDSQPSEFADDPAMIHVRDCIVELERIREQTPG